MFDKSMKEKQPQTPRVVIVTGASSGLGRAIAFEFAKGGAQVVCADLREAPPNQGELPTHEHIQQALQGEASFYSTDVSNEHDMESLVNFAASKYGRLDVIVNNAGIALESHNHGSGPKPITETDSSIFDRTMAVNVKSVFLGCKYAIKQFLAQPAVDPANTGFIVNISSIYGLIGAWGHVSYCTSKGAVAHLTRALAVENASANIHCNAICPGFIPTGMDSKAMADPKARAELVSLHPWGSLGSPSDIADAVVFLSSPKAGWITGVTLPVDGGYTAQ